MKGTAKAADNGHSNNYVPEAALVDIAEIKVAQQARTDFGNIEELAASVRSQGILQPLLLRPNPTGFHAKPAGNGFHFYEVHNRYGSVISSPFYFGKDFPGKKTEAQAKAAAEAEAARLNGGKYLLVAGERRLKAAQMAKLKKVPAIIREMTDEEASAAQVTENLQRKDLKPMEEARGYKQLAEFKGLKTLKEIAERVGKSVEHVASRWPLLNLVEPAQQLVDEGRLPLKHAAYLATLGAETQPAALTKAFQTHWTQKGQVPNYDNPHSFDTFKRVIEMDVLRDLSNAPWPLKQVFEPAPKGCAPSCAVCPYNTANEGALFDAGKQTLCANAVGYNNKMVAWWTIQAETLKRSTGREAVFVANSHNLTKTERKRGGLPATTIGRDECMVIPSNETKCASWEPAVVVQGYIDNKTPGHAITICRDRKCKDHFDRAGASMSSTVTATSSSASDLPNKDQSKKNRERKQELYDLKVNEPVRRKSLAEAIATVKWKKLGRSEWNTIAIAHYCRVRSHTQRIIREVFKAATQTDLPDAHIGETDLLGHQKRIGEIVASLSDDQLAQFMLLCAVGHFGENEHMHKRQNQGALRAFVEHWGVNYALLDATERVAQSSKKYMAKHTEHLRKVREGKADVKDAPHVYDEPPPESAQPAPAEQPQPVSKQPAAKKPTTKKAGAKKPAKAAAKKGARKK